MKFRAIYIILLASLMQACSPKIAQQVQEADTQTPDPALSIIYFPSKLQHSLFNSNWLRNIRKDNTAERPICIVGSIAIPNSLGTSPRAVVPVVEAKLAASGLLRVIHGGGQRNLIFSVPTIPSQQVQLTWAKNQQAGYLLIGEVVKKGNNNKYRVQYQMLTVPDGKKVWEDTTAVNVQ